MFREYERVLYLLDAISRDLEFNGDVSSAKRVEYVLHIMKASAERRAKKRERRHKNG